jgi:hypothetical protein
MWYWSPADAVRTEVDFLLRKGARYLAIEVKLSTLRTEDGIDVLPLGKFFDAVSGGALF